MDVQEDITCTRISEDAVECNGTKYTTPEIYEPGDTWFFIYLGIYIALVLLAGIFSGLTLGLLSLDTTTLQVMQQAGTEREQKNAKKIMPLVKRHHLLLVTLLLANAAAVESMPLFMDKISNEIIAIIVSVTAVLLFGEVFPQALCSRYGLSIGAALVPLVWFLIAIFFIIAWPLSKLLDCILGKDHATFYRRAEIKAIVDIHGPGSETPNHLEEEQLSYDEVLIIKGALDMRSKVGKDAMIPITSVYMIDIDSVLNGETMKQISKASHSRIPIFEGTRKNIVAILLVKTIISFDPEDATPVRDLVKHGTYCRKAFSKSETTPLYDLLNDFQKGKSHLCFMTRAVESTPATSRDQSDHDVPCIIADDAQEQDIVGIITLEDVIEELLGEEIIDETDVYADVHRRVSVAMARRNSYNISPQVSRRGNVSRQSKRQPSIQGNIKHLLPTIQTEDETEALIQEEE